MSRDDHALALRPRWRLEKIGAALVAVAPALWLAGLAYDGDLGVRAVHQAVRESSHLRSARRGESSRRRGFSRRGASSGSAPSA
jgi:hypothetical protein